LGHPVYLIVTSRNVFLSLGIVNPYCEINVGSLTLKTPFIKRTANPIWNVPMQFLLYDLAEDAINIKIFDNKFFSPNGLFNI
jgi:Ca2+-dependent lipid-binding protein